MHSLPSINTDFSASTQEVQLNNLSSLQECGFYDMPFLDNLDFLQALEQEAKLLIARSLLRRSSQDWQSKPDYVRAISLAGLSQHETNLEKLDELLIATEQLNHNRLEISYKAGVNIFFPKFCRDHEIDGFNRTVVILPSCLLPVKHFSRCSGCVTLKRHRKEPMG